MVGFRILQSRDHYLSQLYQNYVDPQNQVRIVNSIQVLKDTCNRKETKMIETLIELRPDIINEVELKRQKMVVDDYSDFTLLMKAVYEGWDEIVKILITTFENVTNINHRNINGSTALSLAVSGDKLECVRLLLSNPNIDVNICHEDEYTVLYQAVYFNKLECVKLLLSHPAIDVNIQCGEFNKTVLWYSSSLEQYVLLAPYYRMMNENEKRMALLCSLYYHAREDFEQTKEKIKQFSHEMLHEMRDALSMLVWISACRGDAKMLEFLISSHSDMLNINIQDKDGATPLFLAVYGGKVDCIKLLLSYPDIDLNFKYGDRFEKTVLWYSGTRDCYELLLPHYPMMKEHEKRMTLLWSMYYHNERMSLEEMKEEMTKFSNEMLYEMSDDVSTLIWMAAYRGNEEIIKFLFSSCGDFININIQDKNGRTALHEAIAGNWKNCVKLLLSHPNIDITINDKVFTSSSLAVFNG